MTDQFDAGDLGCKRRNYDNSDHTSKKDKGRFLDEREGGFFLGAVAVSLALAYQVNQQKKHQTDSGENQERLDTYRKCHLSFIHLRNQAYDYFLLGTL